MRRTKVFEVRPWVGGINTSVDPGVLPAQELVVADNVVWSSSGARIKREALEYIDPAVPTPAFRSSSGTTRTLKFAADALVTTGPTNEKLVVGERITVTGVTNYSATDVEVLTRTDHTGGVFSITYTGTGSVNESEVAAGAITIERASKVICYVDYWRFADNETNTQLGVYATDDFQLFTLDSSGRREQILGQGQITSVVCGAANTVTTGDYFLYNGANDLTNYYVWYNKDVGGGDPAIGSRTAIPVAIVTGDTAAQVATKTQLAIDAVAGLTATVDSATVTIENDDPGFCGDATDGNTGFVVTVVEYAAAAPVNPVVRMRPHVTNERMVLCMTGVNNYPIYYHPETSAKYKRLENAPDAEFMFEHQGRNWCNDKTNRSRLHFSETFLVDVWSGVGDSGALDITPGDGDPEGIINGYAYKGMLIVAKKNSRHRVLGDSPENYFRESLSDGMGNEGPLSIPVDETDVVFMSRRGIHSQAVTDAYGDTDSAYLSADIKPTFNDWVPARLINSQGTYIPELNSIAISVAEDGHDSQNAVWLYNVETKVPGKESPGVWYRWPDISCTALTRRFINDKFKLVFGTANGRIIQAQNEGNYTDFDLTGIPFRIKTGTIYPDNDAISMKRFTKITMIYRPKGNFAFTVKAWIDNSPAQAFSFNQISGLDLLGESFILGNSLLGSSNTLAPFTFTMEGIGRGIVLEVVQPTADEQVEIWGFVLEYEPADVQQAPEES